jgi:thioredoxin 1
MEEDEELRRIRERKLRRLMKKASGKEAESNDQETVKPILDRPIELSDASFSETIKKYPDVVVDCWAPWCGPCRFVSPIVEELARDYAGKIVFGKLNVDENPIVARQYGIMSIPTLLVFKDGKLADQIVGAMPKRMLEARIARRLQKGG